MGGGGWLLDFTRLMQSHLPTIVEVEVEDELGNNYTFHLMVRGLLKVFRLISKRNFLIV